MRTQPPSFFSPHLTDDRLTVIAEHLLDIRYDTIELLNGPLDDNYVRETAAYGRQRNKIIQLALSRKLEWLSLLHAGMDITFSIGSIPCRFFTDDPLHPNKDGFFKKNSTDDLFASDDKKPVTWRFIVSKGNGDAESRVYFIGYNMYNEKICEWIHLDQNGSLYSVDDYTPPSIDIGPAHVALRDKDVEKAAKENDADDADTTDEVKQ